MTITLDGTAGMTAPIGAVYNGLQSTTAVASTSGTSIDFTSIPLWVKRITVMFSGMSTNGTSNFIVQIGSGSFTTSGYLGTAMTTNGATVTNFTSGFLFNNSVGAAQVYSGLMTIVNLTGTTWSETSMLGDVVFAAMRYGAGSVSISGTLDRVRITTASGTDTFDAGTINLIYE